MMIMMFMKTIMMPFNYQVLSIHPCSFAIERKNQKHYLKKKKNKITIIAITLHCMGIF
jgi:accessory gene regulator protein AgrB